MIVRRWPALAGLVVLAVLAVLAVAVAGCAGGAAGPSPTPSGSGLAAAELKYALIDRFGVPWFCDPDAYPVGRDEQARALERWPEIERDGETLAVILRRLGEAPAPTYGPSRKLAIYREWKVLDAIVLDPVGNGRYRFDLRARPADGATEGTRTGGLIDAGGAITVEQQEPAGEPNCPICLDASAPIDTPAGPIRVDRLALGDPIWTVDAAGARTPAVVRAVRSVDAPAGHELVHLVLADGRELLASPGHPLADGREIGLLRVGELVDGSRIASVGRVASGPQTWDVLPSGSTGTYLVDGIAVRSTLAP